MGVDAAAAAVVFSRASWEKGGGGLGRVSVGWWVRFSSVIHLGGAKAVRGVDVVFAAGPPSGQVGRGC